MSVVLPAIIETLENCSLQQKRELNIPPSQSLTAYFIIPVFLWRGRAQLVFWWYPQLVIAGYQFEAEGRQKSWCSNQWWPWLCYPALIHWCEHETFPIYNTRKQKVTPTCPSRRASTTNFSLPYISVLQTKILCLPLGIWDPWNPWVLLFWGNAERLCCSILLGETCGRGWLGESW